MKNNSSSENAALFALGMLPEAEAAEFESRMAADPAVAAEVRDYLEAAADLGCSAAAAPPPGLKDRVINRALAGAEHGMIVVRRNEGEWRKTPFPGVSAKLLLRDEQTGNWTWLLKMEPGSTYPSHRHSTMEQCLVLEGEVSFDDQRFTAGDFEAAPAGTRHSALTSPAGCLLLIIASPHDELLT